LIEPIDIRGEASPESTTVFQQQATRIARFGKEQASLEAAVSASFVFGFVKTGVTKEKKMTAAQIKPSIVFCHGIWADGSCFNKVIPTLQAEGYPVIVAQYGLDTLAGDVATVKRTLSRVGSPAILVGHSYGGSVITAAGVDDRVAALVYIAALAPDANETSQSQIEKFPVTDIFSYIEVADGRVWMLPEGVASFAADLTAEEQKVVWAWHGSRSQPRTSWQPKTTPFNPTWNASWQSAWARPRRRSPAATSQCSRTPRSSST
jgi:pimeloyl-ACP methyl ester carboxylesterase